MHKFIMNDITGVYIYVYKCIFWAICNVLITVAIFDAAVVVGVVVVIFVSGGCGGAGCVGLLLGPLIRR